MPSRAVAALIVRMAGWGFLPAPSPTGSRDPSPPNPRPPTKAVGPVGVVPGGVGVSPPFPRTVPSPPPKRSPNSPEPTCDGDPGVFAPLGRLGASPVDLDWLGTPPVAPT